MFILSFFVYMSVVIFYELTDIFVKINKLQYF